MTNEQLKQINTDLEKKIAGLEVIQKANKENSERLRKEFAKCFGWFNSKKHFSYVGDEQEPILPPWEQIFVEVGKLLNSKLRFDLTSDIKNMDRDIDFIKTILEENGINKKQHECSN